MTKKIAEYQEFLKRDDEVTFTSSKFDIEALPILEYFVIRIFQENFGELALRDKKVANNDF
jgi:hypothetical protein